MSLEALCMVWRALWSSSNPHPEALEEEGNATELGRGSASEGLAWGVAMGHNRIPSFDTGHLVPSPSPWSLCHAPAQGYLGRTQNKLLLSQPQLPSDKGGMSGGEPGCLSLARAVAAVCHQAAIVDSGWSLPAAPLVPRGQAGAWEEDAWAEQGAAASTEVHRGGLGLQGWRDVMGCRLSWAICANFRAEGSGEEQSSSVLPNPSAPFLPGTLSSMLGASPWAALGCKSRFCSQLVDLLQDQSQRRRRRAWGADSSFPSLCPVPLCLSSCKNRLWQL